MPSRRATLRIAVGLVLTRRVRGRPLRLRVAWHEGVVRQVLARVKAAKDVALGAAPKFLGPEIPITGPSAASDG